MIPYRDYLSGIEPHRPWQGVDYSRAVHIIPYYCNCGVATNLFRKICQARRDLRMAMAIATLCITLASVSTVLAHAISLENAAAQNSAPLPVVMWHGMGTYALFWALLLASE